MSDRHRSAITGEFVTAEHAAANPDTTVSESLCTECERLRGVIHTQGVVLDGYLVEVERLRAAEPIVRTVGDLTARHIGKRVRLEGSAVVLHSLAAALDGVLLLSPDGAFRVTSDTPCEVLP